VRSTHSTNLNVPPGAIEPCDAEIERHQEVINLIELPGIEDDSRLPLGFGSARPMQYVVHRLIMARPRLAPIPLKADAVTDRLRCTAHRSAGVVKRPNGLIRRLN